MAQLDLIGLRKRFDDVGAVEDVSLGIEKGELLALLGPSGCGKTTTLSMIAGFLDPDHGEIRLDGIVVNGLPPYRRDMGMVFQSYALFPHMTVFDNVAFGLKMRRAPRRSIEGRVGKALELVGLPHAGRRYPRQLSGGEQQRIALARALVIEPKVLLLDEPLSNLDAKLRERMRVELREIQRQVGITTIFVTHDQAEALSLADRVAVMNRGRLIQVSTPLDIYENPADEFVSGFIGQMNLVPARVTVGPKGPMCVTDRAGRHIVTTVPGVLPLDTPVVLAIRPERISLTETCSGDTIVAAKVRVVVFLGPATVYFVETELGELQVLASNRQGGAYQMGATVYLTWDPADVRVLKRNPSHARHA